MSIVDDNQDAAELLAFYLDRVGYETQLAFDPTAALQLSETYRPESPSPAMANPPTRERSRAAGIDVHLTKPVMGDQLDQVLRDLTHSE